MTPQTPAETRKRILFLSVVLGAMVGVAVYLIVKVLQLQNFVLLVVLLPLAIVAVPLVRNLRALRKSRDSTS